MERRWTVRRLERRRCVRKGLIVIGNAILDVPKLEAWLRAHIHDDARIEDVRRFSGGQSNPTYLIKTPEKSMVLRRKPPGNLLRSAHAIDREYRIISALHPVGFPVPEPIAYCDDDRVVGTPFYLMEYIDGIGLWDPKLPSLEARDRTLIYEGMIDTLASLHNLDVGELGLSDLGRGDDYLGRQLKRWSEQFRASSDEVVPDMELLASRLAATAPDQSRIVLVHGDYKLDNILFDRKLAPAAVIDWELATLGDPLADFTSLLIHWSLPADEATMTGGVSAQIAGIPEIETLVQRYCRATGRDQMRDLQWYLSYNLFRGSCICQGVAGRVKGGNAFSAVAADVAARVPHFLAASMQHARKADIL